MKRGVSFHRAGESSGVTGVGDSLHEAVRRAYEGVEAIEFSGGHYRTDIACQGLKEDKHLAFKKLIQCSCFTRPSRERPMYIVVFGSGSGSNLEALLRAQVRMANETGAPPPFEIKALFTR